MLIIDMIMDLFGLAIDVQTGRRYGFRFFVWKLAAALCFLVAIIFAVLDIPVLCVIGVIAGLVCGAFETRRFLADLRRKKETQITETSKES